MADYRKNDRQRDGGSGYVTGFKDGQPVQRGRSDAPRRPYTKRDGAHDAPYGKKPYSDRNTENDAPRTDRPYGGSRYPKKDADGRNGSSYGNKPYGDRPRSDKPYGDRPRSDKPYGDRPRSDKPYGDRPRSDKPYGDRPRSDKPYGDRPRSDKPYGDRPRSDKPYGDRPYEKKSYGDKPYEGKTYGKKPYERENRPAPDSAPVKNENTERTENADELPYIVMGRNAVREAVKSGRSIDRILVTREIDGSLREVINLARDRNLVIREVDKAKLDEICMPFGHGNRTGNHQGIIAQVPGVEYCEIADILAAAKAKNEPPFIIILDGIEDPHNLGSIIRSAVCAGAHGVIIPKRRATGVTAAACKASAGATEYIKIARVSNLTGAIERLRDAGLWMTGADMSGAPMAKVDMRGAVGLIIGSEGNGISKLVKDNCDHLAAIPMTGEIDSLNAGVAAGILMFEKRRQDGV